jgi:site-specific DNA recombinase
MAAVVYARQSDQKNDKRTNGDSETLSLEAQLASCQAYAKTKGWTINKTYAEQYTGTIIDRPKYLAMVRDIADNHKRYPEGHPKRITTIIVYKYHRLSREPNDIVPLVGIFRGQGVEIEPATEPKIEATPLGELMLYAMSTFAKIMVTDSVASSKASKLLLEKAGKLVCNGPAKYGYEYDRKARTRIINEETAKIVRRIFDELASGRSARSVEMGLTADKIPTPSGVVRPWSRACIRGIVRDPSYYGEPMSTGKSQPKEGRYKNGQKRRTSKPGERTVGESAPAIVTRAKEQAGNNFPILLRV